MINIPATQMEVVRGEREKKEVIIIQFNYEKLYFLEVTI
jgi:hypothetical protein